MQVSSKHAVLQYPCSSCIAVHTCRPASSSTVACCPTQHQHSTLYSDGWPLPCCLACCFLLPHAALSTRLAASAGLFKWDQDLAASCATDADNWCADEQASDARLPSVGGFTISCLRQGTLGGIQAQVAGSHVDGVDEEPHGDLSAGCLQALFRREVSKACIGRVDRAGSWVANEVEAGFQAQQRQALSRREMSRGSIARIVGLTQHWWVGARLGRAGVAL
jgi:hypothetical protein